MLEDTWITTRKAGNVTFTMKGEPGDIFKFTAQREGSDIIITVQQRRDSTPTREQAEKMFSDADLN